MRLPRILHITPHMGGGVGKAIAGLIGAGGASHSIVLLEEPVNKSFMETASGFGADVSVRPSRDALARAMADSDLLVAHWWHNPAMAGLLADFPPVDVRFVIWSHISNLTVPALNPKFISRAGMVWFASPASLDSEAFSSVPEHVMKERCAVVYGSGLEVGEDIPKVPHDGFSIGYIGLLDFSKLHPDFIEFCKAVDVPGARFIMAGDGADREAIERQARSELPKRDFEFLGYVNDVPGLLSRLDVFGYPLMPWHTCATENAIFEAMASRTPPVMLDQLTEHRIVKDGETGLLVSNPAEYGRAMRRLFENPEERSQIGSRARSHVAANYSKEKAAEMFKEAVGRALATDRLRMDFSDIVGESPAEWFMACLGPDERRFRRSFEAGLEGQADDALGVVKECSPLMRMERKGSLLQYAECFPNDPMLRIWADAMRDSAASGIANRDAVL